MPKGLAAAVGLAALALAWSADTGGLAPIIDNERVTVWDVTWTKGTPSRLPRRADDYLVLYLSSGRMALTRPDGDVQTIAASVGEVAFEPRGTVKTEQAVSEEPVRARVIDLHDHYVPPLRNRSGYPRAFPRPGSRKIFENRRVIVWDYTFLPSTPSPMHFHDKDVVVTYLADGALKSTTPEGETQIAEVSFGLTRFNPRNRTHTEQAVRGQPRVIAVELK
jgi:quercetin dioxygenase-like cupin family protein